MRWKVKVATDGYGAAVVKVRRGLRSMEVATIRLTKEGGREKLQDAVERAKVIRDDLNGRR